MKVHHVDCGLPRRHLADDAMALLPLTQVVRMLVPTPRLVARPGHHNTCPTVLCIVESTPGQMAIRIAINGGTGSSRGCSVRCTPLYQLYTARQVNKGKNKRRKERKRKERTPSLSLLLSQTCTYKANVEAFQRVKHELLRCRKQVRLYRVPSRHVISHRNVRTSA